MNTNSNNSNLRTFLIVVGAIVAVILLAVFIPAATQKTPQISYSELVDGLQKPDGETKIIGLLFVDSYEVNVLYNKDVVRMSDFKAKKFKSATAVVTYRDTLAVTIEEIFQDRAIEDRPYISLNDPNSGNFMNYLFPALSFAILLGLGIFMVVSMRSNKNVGGLAGFGKSKAHVANAVKVRFNDVAGAEEEKEELKEVVEFLKMPKKFRQVGARIPKGVLLVGLPGTGKTLFAKAVAGEANVPFFSISGSDFVEMFVGMGASRVRDLFAQAKKNRPCIVFIDEIDAVGRKRGAGLGGGNDEREQTLNQLLVQMDGFEENDGVVIMAATNRVDVLDPALLRPGRFDRQIYVNMPDVAGREGIFRVHCRNKPLSPDIEFKQLARLTTGFSGADIENLLNEAAILAARDNRAVILMKDILEGINKVILGPQKKSRVVTEKDKRITAYHEAGHAIVGKKMKYSEDVQEVSIVPRGAAGGYTLHRAKTDDDYTTKNYLNDRIAVLLGGRAAEELVILDISTGASHDLKTATGLARNMVVEWGMSDALPNIFYGGEQEVFIGRDYQTQSSYSESIATVIDTEIRKIIDKNYERTLKIIKENIDAMHATVRLLFEQETIYGDELDLILEGKSVAEVTEYINNKRSEQESIAEQRRKLAEEMKLTLSNSETPSAPKQNISIRTTFGNASSIIVPEPVKTKEVTHDTAISKKTIETSSEVDSSFEKELDEQRVEKKVQDIAGYRPIGKTNSTEKLKSSDVDESDIINDADDKKE
ncbi:MAG: ATP-dependent zinc metalloprotease FtsH [Christensenellaceae bacterium]|jgi:cell division protease FtsH|nr:ATP-dependent zinc metalloprotease FtsH [Christensenellaceae bacterium]